MKLGKGLKRRTGRFEEAVSDPGSEDSWDLLYRVDKSNPSQTSVKSNHGQTSGSVHQARPVSAVKDTKEVVDGEDMCRGREHHAHANLRLVIDAASGKGTSLPVTSTPFVNRKQAPQFEVSTIISPVDDGTLNDQSGTILIVNRKNPGPSADETFNKLVYAGNGRAAPSSGNSGVKPLKSVENQADTTRHYAGGAVLTKKRSQILDLSDGGSGCSWETAEEKTASSSNKYTSNSETHKIRSRRTPLLSVNDVSQSSATNNNVVQATRDIVQTGDKKSVNLSQDQKFKNSEVQKISEAISASSNETKAKPSISLGEASSSSQQIKVTVSNPKIEVGEGGRSAVVIVEKLPEQKISSERFAYEKSSSFHSKDSVGLIFANKTAATEKIAVLHEDQSSSDNRKAVNGGSNQEDNNGPNKEQQQKRGKFKNSYECERQEGKRGSSSNTAIDHNNTIQPIKSSQVHAGEKKQDILNQADGIVDQEIKEAGTKNCEQEITEKTSPLRCANSSEAHFNIMKPIVGSQEDLENVNNDVLKRTDEDFNQLVAQNATDKICNAGEKNMMFCYNSNFVVKFGKHVIAQSGQFGFGLQGNKCQATVGNSAQPLSYSRLNTVFLPCDEQRNLQHDQVKNTCETNEESIPSKERSCDEVLISKELDDHPNTDSSSEEEKKLLVAQSVQLRKNQSHACRKMKTPKIIESKSQASQATSDACMSLHQKPDTEQKQGEGSNQGECGPSPPLQPCKNVLNSSCDSLIYVSRNPHDCYTADDENFQLEIMSSSEEEGFQMNEKTKKNKVKLVKDIKNRLLQKDQEPAVTHQSQKGLNLSFKAKQIRRRREEKIQTLLKSRRGSSDSDPHISPSVSNTRSKRGKFSKYLVSCRTHHKEGNETPCNAAQNGTEICDQKAEAHENFDEYEPDNAPKVRCAESPRKELTKEGGKKLSSQEQEEDAAPKRQSPQVYKHESRSNDINSKLVDGNLYQSSEENFNATLGDAEKIVYTNQSLKEVCVNISPCKKRGLKRIMSTHNDLGSSEVPEKVSRRKQNKDNKHIKSRFQLCSSEKAEEIRLGTRYSSRTRKAPSAYWLGRTALTKAPESESDHEDISDETFIPAQKIKEDDVKKKAKTNQNQKREVCKHDGPVNVQRVTKQSIKELKSSQMFDYQKSADQEEVLEYEGVLENLSNKLKMYEKKKFKCVWDSQMEGDLLYLGRGAGFSNFNQDIAIPQSAVFYLLEGEICYQLNNDMKKFSPNSFFILPQGKSYHVKNVGNSTAKLVMIGCKE